MISLFNYLFQCISRNWNQADWPQLPCSSCLPSSQPGRVPLCEEPCSPTLLPRAPGGSQPGPAPVRGTAAVVADRCFPQPSSDHQSIARILPFSPSCPVLVTPPLRVFLNFIPCYMYRPLMPTLSHLHVSQFSVCFLLPCEAPEDWLTEPVDLSLCFLTFLCIGMTYVRDVAIVPIDNADAPQRTCFPECLLTSTLGCLWLSVVLSKASQWENAETQLFNEIVDFTHFQLDFPNLHKTSCFRQCLCLFAKVSTVSQILTSFTPVISGSVPGNCWSCFGLTVMRMRAASASLIPPIHRK